MKTKPLPSLSRSCPAHFKQKTGSSLVCVLPFPPNGSILYAVSVLFFLSLTSVSWSLSQTAKLKLPCFIYWKSNFLGGSPRSSWVLPSARVTKSKCPACQVFPCEPRMWSLRFPAHRIGILSEAQEAGMSLVNNWKQQVQRRQDWKRELWSRYKIVFSLSFTDLCKSPCSRKPPKPPQPSASPIPRTQMGSTALNKWRDILGIHMGAAQVMYLVSFLPVLYRHSNTGPCHLWSGLWQRLSNWCSCFCSSHLYWSGVCSAVTGIPTSVV